MCVLKNRINLSVFELKSTIASSKTRLRFPSWTRDRPVQSNTQTTTLHYKILVALTHNP